MSDYNLEHGKRYRYVFSDASHMHGTHMGRAAFAPEWIAVKAAGSEGVRFINLQQLDVIIPLPEES